MQPTMTITITIDPTRIPESIANAHATLNAIEAAWHDQVEQHAAYREIEDVNVAGNRL